MKIAVGACLVMPLTGCMSDGLDVFSSTDKKATTSAIQPGYKAPSDTVSDEVTVRNAVTSTDLGQLGGAPIPWANTSTGSAGVITMIREENNGSYVCRIFTTTRHSYTGIANYKGKACLVGSGEWQLITFSEKS
jgi:hypothetical protein